MGRSAGRSDDVYRSVKRLCAIHTRCGTLKHLYTLYVIKGNGEVGTEVSCLWIADIDTVKKNSNLVKSASADGDVRLYTKATALTDIHARG